MTLFKCRCYVAQGKFKYFYGALVQAMHDNIGQPCHNCCNIISGVVQFYPGLLFSLVFGTEMCYFNPLTPKGLHLMSEIVCH